MRIDLPTPPSVNSMFCNNSRSGRGRFKSAKYRQWLALAATALKEQGIQPITYESLALTIRVARPTSRSDLDNRIKAIPDLLQSCGIIKDDKRIARLDVEWLPRDAQSYVVVEEYKNNTL